MSHSNIIKNNYQQVGAFFKYNKGIVITATTIFSIAIIVSLAGVLYNDNIREAFSALLADVMNSVSPDDTAGELFTFIFFNNLRAMTMMIVLGIFPFIFLPVFPLATNGGVIALVAVISREQGMSMPAFFAYLLPHGIIELPILILCCSLGFYLCLTLTKKIISKASIKKCLINIARVYVSIALPAILLAALIEAYITPAIGGLFL